MELTVFANKHFILFCVFLERVAVRPRSAEKCMVWSAGTNGALPVAGRKPANASRTKKDFRRWERIFAFFLFSSYFLHCRRSLVSLFYLFCFPTTVQSVLSHIPTNWTLVLDVDNVWSSRIRTLIEFCPLMRLMCTPFPKKCFLGIFYPGLALHVHLRYLSDRWFFFVYCGRVASNIFMMFFYCRFVSLKGVTV